MTRRFESIAIIGQGCALPGCLRPDELWTAVRAGRSLLAPLPTNGWRIDTAKYLSAPPGLHSVTPVRSDVGGFITAPSSQLALDGLGLSRNELEELDPVVQWSVHAAACALADAKVASDAVPAERAGVILGNLSYPTRALTRFFEHVVLKDLLASSQPPAALNRYMSGLPALLTARAVGFAGPAFCLDAACASGLYAIKLACDKLQRGDCDLMLAGGVNASDPLFIFSGFATLQALSQTGRSRPFHREADGLVPSEGAAFVVLKRLADAERDGDAIAGVIRGIGLSNDGRSGGFLSPSAEGQERAMRAAFAGAGDLTPADVSLIECHATGTAAGDGVELKGLEAIYGRRDDLHLTALKANLGHSITTSAVAGVLKMIAALKHGIVAPTPNAFPTLPFVDACGYRVHDRAADWAPTAKGYVAAVSAFGMGGNNAHLLLERWEPKRVRVAAVSPVKIPIPIAIVAVGVRTDRCADTAAFAAALLQGAVPPSSVPPHEATAAFDPKTLTSPPRDLRHALGQQLLLLETAIGTMAGGVAFEAESTGVFVGMQADPDISRHLLRIRLGELLQSAGKLPTDEWIAEARRLIEAPMEPPDIVGTMPNIPANRLHHQFDFRGPGFTVSAEENSGVAALTIALDALQSGELTAAVIGAVDLSRETCQEAADTATRSNREPAADAAVVLVLKPLAAAQAAGDPILATIETTSAGVAVGGAFATSRLIGHAHAAAGLLEIAAATLAVSQAAKFDATALKLVPQLENRVDATTELVLAPSQAKSIATRVTLRRHAASDRAALPLPKLHLFAGADLTDLRRRVEANEAGGEGACRLAFAATSAADAAEKNKTARAWLARVGISTDNAPDGIHFHREAIGGDVALAFTGAAAAYPGMGRELLVGLPALLDGSALVDRLPDYAGWIFDPACTRQSDPFLQLAGTSFLSQMHARFTRDVLGVRPQMALGLSSGETNAMFALGCWDDMDGLFAAVRDSGLYAPELAGDFTSVRRHWSEPDTFKVEWETWLVRAPVAAVRSALTGESRVYLTIVNTADDCVIAGDRAACARVLARVGQRSAVPLGYNIAVHCPVVTPFEPTWRKIHTRPTRGAEGVRVYSNFFGGVYTPSDATVADALTGQALQTLDLPKIVEAAWRDGARVFVEHGPRNHLTSAIGAILGDRPHVAVALDVAGRSSLTQAAEATAALWAAGVPVRTEAFGVSTAESKSNGGRMTFSLRKPAIVLPPLKRAEALGRPEMPAPRVLVRPPTLLTVAATTGLVSTSPPESTEPVTPEGRMFANLQAAHRAYVDQQASAWQAFLRQQQQLHSAALAVALESGGETPPSLPPIIVTDLPVAPPRRADLWEVAEPLPPRGPKFDRAQLETLASGKISSVFGEEFAQQDLFAVQVRMPEPPLLLCDRVIGIEGEPGGMGQGIIWTETDVREDSWYLHCGRMPGGIFIEAGQADLLLISWLGVDFLNRGERAYRLLGCELMFHEALPKVGETLRYQIHVDRHANQGAVRLFFFHYDCWVEGRPRISVRNGQAGFFTRAELANSGGVLWSAEDAAYSEPAQVDVPEHATTKTAFSADDVQAFARGELEHCFGASFDWAWIHSRTPTIALGRNNLIGEIAQLDPRGGPAGRGYLRAVRRLTPDDWFFDGHFKNDPCMPGTLMAEGCLQAMTFYLVALGYSRDRDGWRCEPVPETKYTFVCRGQATPESRELVYELFVDEVRFVGDQPVLFAHVLCTVDGLKAFKCERLGLRMVKDFPLTSLPRAAWERPERLPVAQMDGLTLDYKSILACALGHPVDAFGPTFETFTKVLRAPRLPNPPFLFCTHVARAERTPQKRESKAFVDMLYDIEDDAWYFTENSNPVMTLTASMEIALQACGWLSSFVLEPQFATWEPLFRNLDGIGTYYREVFPGDGVINTRVQLTSRMVLGEQIIVRFHVLCTVRGEKMFECTTTFGSFSPAALADTKGMVPSAAELAAVTQPGHRAEDLAASRERYRVEKRYELPGARLLRLDRVTGIWPRGGAYGLGYIRAEKDVRKRDWVFKAHFYQDPVQPGSIGVESVMQSVRLFMLETEAIPAGHRPEFESILMGHEFDWTYRGQVLPRHKLVTVDFDAKERIVHDDGVTITGDGRLWVDGKKIYSMARFGTRVRFVRCEEPALAAQEARAIDVKADESGLVTPAEQLRAINIRALRRRFLARFGSPGPVLQDLFLGLIQQFVGGVDVAEPARYAELKDRPVLYLANHQVGVESVLFVALVDALNAVACRAIAKREHRDSWIGRILQVLRAQTGRDSMVLFDRADPNDLLNLLGGMMGKDGRLSHSLMAHVQGTRSLRAGEPTTKVSAALLDLAIRGDLPIVPVRFSGGLPRTPLAQRIEFPTGFGGQRYALGRIILPDELRALGLRDRKARVIEAINGTGLALDAEEPAQPDDAFTARVTELQSTATLTGLSATLIACLERLPERSAETDILLGCIGGASANQPTGDTAILLQSFGIGRDHVVNR